MLPLTWVLASLAAVPGLQASPAGYPGPSDWIQFREEAGAPPVSAAEGFYCQTPLPVVSINASTGAGFELADDIPTELAGSVFNEVTLWIAEWALNDPSHWRDPAAVWIRLYDGACPPPQTSYLSYRVPWSDVETTLWWPGNPWVVYETRIPLPEDGVVPPTPISMGVQVENSWGVAVPYLGIMALEHEDGYGCGLWASSPPQNIPRWTLFGGHDAGFCLGYAGTSSVPDGPASVRTGSWGSLKTGYR